MKHSMLQYDIYFRCYQKRLYVCMHLGPIASAWGISVQSVIYIFQGVYIPQLNLKFFPHPFPASWNPSPLFNNTILPLFLFSSFFSPFKRLKVEFVFLIWSERGSWLSAGMPGGRIGEYTPLLTPQKYIYIFLLCP